MKLGVFNPVLYNLSLEDALKYLSGLGITMFEFGCGGYPGTKHGDINDLVAHPEKVKELKELFLKYKITISALSIHGNGVHPDKKVADQATFEFDSACKVAKDLGVQHIVTFSGCPGDKTSTTPNWITCAWPNEYADLLKWQWEEVLIPYWKERVKVAQQNGIKICLEMHPGFAVYNPDTLLKLRAAVGNTIGANLDPSHLLWQGVDIVAAIKKLGAANALYYFHAKDTQLNKEVVSTDGVLDTKPYSLELQRSWIFRTVGYGGVDWRGVFSALRSVGYDYVISVEHEDSLMTPKEGLEKGIKYLNDVVIFDGSKAEIYWA